MVHRRTLLASSAALLAAPAILRAAEQTTLKFVPQTDIAGYDPVWSSAQVTRNYAYLVFDTLYGVNKAYEPKPQMAAGASHDASFQDWLVTLRTGLRFHDGEPVLARDCIASLIRWGKRDSFGMILMESVDEISAPDDRTLRFRMKKPFPLLRDALAKSTANMAGIMPERLALTDPYKQIPEVIGSGPFRLMPGEGVSGDRIVFARNADYLPRTDGAPEWTSGPKIVRFDRVEWRIIPDAATAAAALQNGEIDWWETPTTDYLPLLRKSRDVTVALTDPSGSMPVLRMNWLQPPFDNPAIRRAVLAATSQLDFMQAAAGTDTDLYRTGVGIFPPGTACATTAGLDAVTTPPDFAKIRRDLAAAGYSGERVVVLGVSDRASVKAMGDVAADMLQKIGMTIDYQIADAATVNARSARKATLAQGGWSIFFGIWSGLSTINPVVHQSLRGNGDKAWSGWPASPRLEELRGAWLDAPSPVEQRRIVAEIQMTAFREVPYVPLGQFFQPVAYRRNLSGIVTGFPIFWNVRRS